MHDNIRTILLMVVFATAFIIIGTVVPALVLGTAPQSTFVEVHDFSASDTHVGAQEHTVCFERTVHRPSQADISIELLLVSEDGKIIEEDSFEIDAYYQEGREKVVITRQIRTPSLEPGVYRYRHSAELTYYNGWVTRQFNFESEKFRVYENESQLEQNETTC